MLELIFNLIGAIFGITPTSTSTSNAKPQPQEAKMAINWDDPTSKVSKYFTVKECTYLPSWGVCHLPSDDEKANIIKMTAIMDVVRDYLGNGIKVHVWIRPGALNNPASVHNGEDYNLLVKGATHSAHKVGKAVDWDCGENCDDTRNKLLSKLEELGLRMEDAPGSNWVHLDCAEVPPGGHRFFKP